MFYCMFYFTCDRSFTTMPNNQPNVYCSFFYFSVFISLSKQHSDVTESVRTSNIIAIELLTVLDKRLR